MGHISATGTSPSVQVTAGKTLVVAHVAVGLVTWLAQDGCLVSAERCGMDSLEVRLGEARAGRQGLPMAMLGSCSGL